MLGVLLVGDELRLRDHFFPFVICYSLFVIRCSLFVIRYSLFVVRCSLLATEGYIPQLGQEVNYKVWHIIENVGALRQLH